MSVNETRKIRRLGASQIVTLPYGILNKLNIREGEKVGFSIENGKIVIEKLQNEECYTSEDILNIAERMSEKYDETLKELVDK